MPAAYLAGPDVFLPDAARRGEYMKRYCAEHGLKAIFPADVIVDPEDSRSMYLAMCRTIRASDICIANLNPFRGPNVDDGTAFEIGMFAAMGKPVIGYSDWIDWTYQDRVWPDGYVVEDLNLPCNLMLYWGCTRIFRTFECAVQVAAHEYTWIRA